MPSRALILLLLLPQQTGHVPVVRSPWKMTWLVPDSEAIARDRAYVKPLILTKEGGPTYAQIPVRKGGEDLPEQFLPSYLGPQD